YRRDVLYSSRRRHTRSKRDWSSDVCSSDLPQAKFKFELPAKKAGVVTEIIANEIGKAALMLGAGRETQKSVIDLSVGIVLHKKIDRKSTRLNSIHVSISYAVFCLKKKMASC